MSHPLELESFSRPFSSAEIIEILEQTTRAAAASPDLRLLARKTKTILITYQLFKNLIILFWI
jgi:hypothetical protein